MPPYYFSSVVVSNLIKISKPMNSITIQKITQAIEKGNPKTKGSTLLPKENTGKINIIKIKRVNTTKIIFELIAWLFFTVVPLNVE